MVRKIIVKEETSQTFLHEVFLGKGPPDIEQMKNFVVTDLILNDDLSCFIHLKIFLFFLFLFMHFFSKTSTKKEGFSN